MARDSGQVLYVQNWGNYGMKLLQRYSMQGARLGDS